jgi:hypothetical protein
MIAATTLGIFFVPLFFMLITKLAARRRGRESAPTAA